MNMSNASVEFTLPTGRSWGRLMDTQAYFDQDGSNDEPDGFFNDNEDLDRRKSANIQLDNPRVIDGASYTLSAFSIVIMEEAQ